MTVSRICMLREREKERETHTHTHTDREIGREGVGVDSQVLTVNARSVHAVSSMSGRWPVWNIKLWLPRG